MRIYYNEFNPHKAQWLEQLIKDGIIPAGDVDNRSIKEVKTYEIKKYTQCHFFAGIGGWALALALANWDPNRSVWTGSCPCQPFSDQGKRNAQKDERHLWPEWFRLIRESKPSEVFGEQVDNAIAFGWLDEAALDLESHSYAFASAVLPAASTKARHLRERAWFYGRHTPSYRKTAQQEQKSRSTTGISRIDYEIDWMSREASQLPFSLLADGVPAKLRRLLREGFGDAIVPYTASKFIQATMEI